MNRNKYLLLIFNLFVLFGCGMSQPVERPQNFAIVADNPVKTYSKKYDTLLIDSVRVESPFNDTQWYSGCLMSVLKATIITVISRSLVPLSKTKYLLR